jgi:alkylation response protein AidB-like acyl-CoA dehydrogenase
MHFDFDEIQREIRDTARSLLTDRVTPARRRAAAEARAGDDDLWRELSELGWPGVALPEQYGGQGLGMVEQCLVLDEQGAALAPVPLLPSACAARVILRAGDEAQREAWLPRLATGEARAAIGDDELVAGTGGADVFVVLGDGEARLIEAAQTSLEVVDTIDQLRSYARVERACGELLPGDIERGRHEASIAAAAELLGVARRALALSVDYAKERRQFGAPIGSFQAVAHRCADMLLDVESAHSAVYYAAWVADAGHPELAEAAALAKLQATRAARAVTASAIQVHGGVGFTWESDLHWWFKRAQLSGRLLGGASRQLQDLGQRLIARAT